VKQLYFCYNQNKKSSKKAVSSILAAVILVTLAVVMGSMALNFVKGLLGSQEDFIQNEMESKLEGFDEQFVTITDAYHCKAMQLSVQDDIVNKMNSVGSSVRIVTDHTDLIFSGSMLSSIQSLLSSKEVYVRGPVTMDLEYQMGSTIFSTILSDSDFYILHDSSIETDYLILDNSKVFEIVVSDCAGKMFITDLYEIYDPVLKSEVIINYTFSVTDASNLLNQMHVISEINTHNILMDNLKSKINQADAEIIFYSNQMDKLIDLSIIDSLSAALQREVDVKFVGNLSDLFVSKIGVNAFAGLMDDGLKFDQKTGVSPTEVYIDGDTYQYNLGVYTDLIVSGVRTIQPTYGAGTLYTKAKYNLSSEGLFETWDLFSTPWNSASLQAISYNNSRLIRELILSGTYNRGDEIQIVYKGSDLLSSDMPYLFDSDLGWVLSEISKQGVYINFIINGDVNGRESDKALFSLGSGVFSSLLTSGSEFKVNSYLSGDYIIFENQGSQIKVNSIGGKIFSYTNSSITYDFDTSFFNSPSIGIRSVDFSQELKDVRISELSRKLYSKISVISNDFRVSIPKSELLLSEDVVDILLSKSVLYNITVVGPINKEVLLAYGGSAYFSNAQLYLYDNTDVNMLIFDGASTEHIINDGSELVYNYSSVQLDSFIDAYIDDAVLYDVDLEPVLVIDNVSNSSPLSSFTLMDVSLTNAGDRDTVVRIDMFGEDYSRCIVTNTSSSTATSGVFVNVPNHSTITYPLGDLKLDDNSQCCRASVKLYANGVNTPVVWRIIPCLGS